MPNTNPATAQWSAARAARVHELVTLWSQTEPNSRPTLAYYLKNHLRAWDHNNPKPN